MGLQARAIVEAFADHPIEPLVTLALDSGARLGELLALRWQDVNFDERTIRIERTWQRDRFEQPKTKKSKYSEARPMTTPTARKATIMPMARRATTTARKPVTRGTSTAPSTCISG